MVKFIGRFAYFLPIFCHVYEGVRDRCKSWPLFNTFGTTRMPWLDFTQNRYRRERVQMGWAQLSFIIIYPIPVCKRSKRIWKKRLCISRNLIHPLIGFFLCQSTHDYIRSDSICNKMVNKRLSSGSKTDRSLISKCWLAFDFVCNSLLDSIWCFQYASLLDVNGSGCVTSSGTNYRTSHSVIQNRTSAFSVFMVFVRLPRQKDGIFLDLSGFMGQISEQ